MHTDKLSTKYAFNSDNKCALFARLGGGVAEKAQCDLFYRSFYIGASLTWFCYAKNYPTSPFKKYSEVKTSENFI